MAADTLFEWRFFALAQRVELIERETTAGSQGADADGVPRPISVAPSTLGLRYRRDNVGYKRPKYHITNDYSDEEMLQMQELFTMTLTRYMSRPRFEVIFIDET